MSRRRDALLSGGGGGATVRRRSYSIFQRFRGAFPPLPAVPAPRPPPPRAHPYASCFSSMAAPLRRRRPRTLQALPVAAGEAPPKASLRPAVPVPRGRVRDPFDLLFMPAAQRPADPARVYIRCISAATFVAPLSAGGPSNPASPRSLFFPPWPSRPAFFFLLSRQPSRPFGPAFPRVAARPSPLRVPFCIHFGLVRPPLL